MARSRGELLEDVEYENLGDRDPGAESDDGMDDGASADGRSAGPAIRLLSKMGPKEKFRILRSHFWADQEASSNWRVNANEAFGFVAGEQLSTDDKALLDAQQRPHIVFNRVQTILKAVAGMQINGRNDVKFLPRNNNDTEVNEVLSAASKWMADGCDAEDEESAALLAVQLGLDDSRLEIVRRRTALPGNLRRDAGDLGGALGGEHAVLHRNVDLAVGDVDPRQRILERGVDDPCRGGDLHALRRQRLDSDKGFPFRDREAHLCQAHGILPPSRHRPDPPVVRLG